MSSFTGFVNLKKDISKEKDILKNMSSKMLGDENQIEEYVSYENLCLAHKTNKKNKISTYKCGNLEYTIAFNGEIYNKQEIKEQLQEEETEILENSNEEIVLKAIVNYGIEILQKINGFFSFVMWNNKKQELILARDHFGIKPLYYTITNDTLIFSTQIKSILEHPLVTPIIDNQTICEIFGLRACAYSRYYTF